MSEPVRSADADAGFSLVEVLVGLVLVSMVALALGGLISFATSLRDQSDRAEKTLRALLDLQAVRSAIAVAIGRADGVDIIPNGASAVTIISTPPRLVLPLRVTLAEATATRSLTLNLSYDTSEQSDGSSVDLSMFDHAFIDYLAGPGDAAAWGWVESTPSPIATRLVVVQGLRQWSVLLWVVPVGR